MKDGMEHTKFILYSLRRPLRSDPLAISQETQENQILQKTIFRFSNARTKEKKNGKH